MTCWPCRLFATCVIDQITQLLGEAGLLDSAVYLGLSQRPQRLTEELTAKDRIVVIDEIQRLPLLLNEVHRLIEQRGTRFLPTGSSARKLRQGGVNLLGGRETMVHFIVNRLGFARRFYFWCTTGGRDVLGSLPVALKWDRGYI